MFDRERDTIPTPFFERLKEAVTTFRMRSRKLSPEASARWKAARELELADVCEGLSPEERELILAAAGKTFAEEYEERAERIVEILDKQPIEIAARTMMILCKRDRNLVLTKAVLGWARRNSAFMSLAA